MKKNRFTPTVALGKNQQLHFHQRYKSTVSSSSPNFSRGVENDIPNDCFKWYDRSCSSTSCCRCCYRQPQVHIPTDSNNSLKKWKRILKRSLRKRFLKRWDNLNSFRSEGITRARWKCWETVRFQSLWRPGVDTLCHYSHTLPIYLSVCRYSFCTPDDRLLRG